MIANSEDGLNNNALNTSVETLVNNFIIAFPKVGMHLKRNGTLNVMQ